jgi:predicted nucleic acid-binding protein
MEAGMLSFALKKKGKTINLTDCYIAILAKEHKCSILTLDKHFKEIQKETGLKILSF